MRFDPTRKFSFAENNAKWRERRKLAREQFEASQAAATNMLNINQNKFAGMTQITMRMVAERNNEVLKAKAAEQMKRLDELQHKFDIEV